MINGYEKLRIPDENKTQEVLLEVNWNAKDECKFIRISLGDKTAVIKKEHFLAFLFSIGNEDEQRKMIPQTQTKSRWYETVITVKAKKDIRAGEDLTFPIKLSLPALTTEVVDEIKS